ncbi:hypothetical protein RUE5091_03309 [Ruegeria denitrificans]|uniref:Uncharacterized protein n=1 Tax=Ruegeria denitrificans TaxID=1715692 RepID=A0A0P1INM5_9RHOB|nr:hypothetical protein RUE5091_03309 [Ruegeria denitrificans]
MTTQVNQFLDWSILRCELKITSSYKKTCLETPTSARLETCANTPAKFHRLLGTLRSPPLVLSNMPSYIFGAGILLSPSAVLHTRFGYDDVGLIPISRDVTGFLPLSAGCR